VAALVSDFEFMRAADIVDAEVAGPDAEYGFDQPVDRFTFEFAEDSAIKSVQVLIGRRVTSDEKKVYLKRDASDAVYVVDTTWMDTLNALDDPAKDNKASGDTSPQAKKED
jgi:hypothetical protein